MFKWIVRWIDRIFAVVGALVFAQAPLFIQQYTQQLSGHISELSWQVNKIALAAQNSGKTVEQFIGKFVSNGDADIAQQGTMMQTIISRYELFQNGLSSLNEASLVTKPLVFIHYLDFDIAKSTFHIFKPGIPMTLEGLIYAFIGLVLGYGFFYGLCKVLGGFFYLFKPKSKPPQPQNKVGHET